MSLCQVVNAVATRARLLMNAATWLPIVLTAQAGAATQNAILGVDVYGQ